MSYKENDFFEITGGRPLRGVIEIQTSKNAVLPIMSASMLTNERVVLHEIPDILDVENMIKIMKDLGVKVELADKTLTLDPGGIEQTNLDFSLCKTMRSSIFLLGSLLNRFKKIMLTTPGGCKIGSRPIDLHLKAFKKMGVKIQTMGEYIFFDATNAHSARIKLSIPSVGATENIVQFASLIRGKTEILNPAREPEVVDLCNFLSLMGAKILGAGTEKITIYGVDRLYSTEYKPISDRIVAGTILVACAMTGGEVRLKNAIASHNEKIIKILASMGCQIKSKHDIIEISSNGSLVAFPKIKTGYYPEFPTDLQSMMLSLLAVSEGESEVEETIFENRFLTVNALKSMGADITQRSENAVKIRGVLGLNGTEVTAFDLRGGASLVLLGLVARGVTVVKNVHFIDRGYDHLEEMLALLGADIKRK